MSSNHTSISLAPTRRCVIWNKSSISAFPAEGSVYLHNVQSILSRNTQRTRLARKALLWLAFAKSSLDLTELQEALAVLPRSAQTDFTNKVGVSMLIRVCEGLVEVDYGSGNVRFAHPSIKELLITDMQLSTSANGDIFLACLTYLMYPEFSDGPCENGDALLYRFKRYPLLRYAGLHLVAHWKEH